MIFVVMDLQLAAQHVRGPGGAGFQVIAEMVMLAVAGPVLVAEVEEDVVQFYRR